MKKKPKARKAPKLLGEQFPEEWKALIAISDFKKRQSELERELRPIVAMWKPHIMFRRKLIETTKGLARAINEIENVRKIVAILPKSYIKNLDKRIEVLFRTKVDEGVAPTTVASLSDAALALVLIRAVLLLQYGSRQPESSKPTEIHKVVVHLLHGAWTRLHGAGAYSKQNHLQILWPKKGKDHPSTVFVFHALHMIDPSVTPARARTAIEKVLDQPEKFKRIVRFVEKFEDDTLDKLPKALGKLIEKKMFLRLAGGAAAAGKSKQQRY